MSGHWSDRFVGLPYIENTADCASLAVLVQKEVFGKEIILPNRECGLRGMSSQIANLQADYAEKTDSPVDGDAVLMYCRGRLFHVGVYTQINGVDWVLHSLKNAGMVCRHRIRDLEKYNLAFEGFYRWI